MRKDKYKLNKIIQQTEFKLFLFLGYVASLAYTWVTGHRLLPVLFTHLFFVIFFSAIYFGPKFLLFFFAPMLAVIQPFQNYFSKRYLRAFKQNELAEVVIVLGKSNWFKLESWIKHNYLKSELESLVHSIKADGKDFSFYPDANLVDVEKIMIDKNVKEVYFLGHGSSHTFQLSPDEILYYCDFNDPKYSKEYVHQVHCGTWHGKSLIDYVVPEKNKTKCFIFRKPINSFDIQKEFKKRERAALVR